MQLPTVDISLFLMQHNFRVTSSKQTNSDLDYFFYKSDIYLFNQTAYQVIANYNEANC